MERLSILNQLVLVMCVLGSLGMFHVTRAQISPQYFLNALNAERALAGRPPLTWDNKLYDYAKKYAARMGATCELKYSNGPYGETVATSPRDMSAILAVQTWMAERNRPCAQVVAANTQRVGCAKVRCKNGGTFIVCNYEPRCG